MRKWQILWIFAMFMLFSGPGPRAWAWENHALGTRVALASLPEFQGSDGVAVEPIEAFVRAEEEGLARLLQEEEAWAQQTLAGYPPIPDPLRFRAGAQGDARARFLRALRVNPEMRLALYLQRLPGAAAEPARPPIPIEAVTLLPGQLDPRERQFAALSVGETIPALDVVTTASDEPDYGLDIGLWEDSGTEFGRSYGFGKQPFGNPALSFSSQAPFHMGFFHEDPIVYKAAGFVRRTYPELRIHQYLSLARFAFSTGHPYWGWRFAGWGVHHIQDLTQPYHSTLLPGVGIVEMLWINSIDLLGIHGPKADRVALVSNRHLALENYGYHRLRRALANTNGEDESATLQSLRRAPGAGAEPLFEMGAVRDSITLESNQWAARADRIVTDSLPAKYVSDPRYVFGVTEPEVNALAVAESGPRESLQAIQGLFVQLMQNFGKHTRAFVLSAATPGK